MNRRKVLFAVSILIGLVGIGGGIVVYLSTRPSGSERVSRPLTPGTPGLTVSEISSSFDCPCGHCSLSLDNCECGVADQIRSQISSLIMNDVSKNEITDAMVRQHGRQILRMESKVPPYYEEASGVDLPNTLDPESVYPGAKPGYEAARVYPELLMQLPCFCGCEIERGARKAHKSLLDCFADKHGESCRICIDEAVFASKRFEDGTEPEEIRREIAKVWGSPAG